MNASVSTPLYRELLSEDVLELWEERASIMEFDGGIERAEAEWLAFLLVQGELTL